VRSYFGNDVQVEVTELPMHIFKVKNCLLKYKEFGYDCQALEEKLPWPLQMVYFFTVSAP
jgi:hypothetical protein